MASKIWRWLVHTAFRLLYNEFAWTYDLVSWSVSLGEWRKWQAAGLPFVRGDRVLEIAHGPGHMLLALAKSGRQVTGVDLSPFMGRIAARRLRRAGRRPALVRGAAQALPFRTQAFETVYCTFPTYFIAERRTMEAIHRVLCGGGRYIIIPEGHLTGGGLVQGFISWLYKITGQRDDVFAVDDEESWPARTPRWLAFRQAMQETGFKIDVQRRVLGRSEVTVVIATRV